MKRPGNKNKQQRFRHNSYLGTDLIYQHLESLEKQFDSLEMERIGVTGEGRDIKIVKINAAVDPDLPTIFIDAGIHAREWISPAATLFLIEKLARQLNKVRYTNRILMLCKDGYHYIPRHKHWDCDVMILILGSHFALLPSLGRGHRDWNHRLIKMQTFFVFKF